MLKLKIHFPFFVSFIIASFGAFSQTPKSIKTIIVDAGHGGKDYGAHGGYEGGLNSYEKNVTLAISNRVVAELRKQLPNVTVIPTRTTDVYQSVHEKADIANENKGDLFVCIHADAVALQTGKRQIGERQEKRTKVTYTGKGKKKKKHTETYYVTVPIYQYYKIGSQRTGTTMWLFASHKTDDKADAVLKNGDIEEIEVGGGIDSAVNNIDFSGPEYKMMAQVHVKRYQDKSIKLAHLLEDEIVDVGRESGIHQRSKGIWVLQATNMPAVLIETGFITNYNDERYLNSEKGQQELAECITRAIKKYKEQLESGKASNTIDSAAEKKVMQEAKQN